MIVTHRILRTWQRKVDAFVAVSEFEKSILTKAGLPQERIHAKPNFVTPDPGESREPRRDVLFVGRLTAEKGIVTLIQAWKSSRRRCDLVIVGDGPLSPYVTEQAGDSSHIRYLGRRSAKDVYDLMGRSSYVLFPSEWYETFGRVAIEAFAKGTPVIGSDIGAIPEVVHHERTGILFRPGDVGELARSMDWADEHPERLAAMGRDCRNEYEAKYTDVVNYESMMRIYAAATSRNSSICDERTAGREE
jgi:glycosyltransferase involved in cell wall biosynthesis